MTEVNDIIEKELADEEVKFVRLANSDGWAITFDVEGEKVPIVVMNFPARVYVSLFTAITECSLDRLSAEILRELLIASSDIMLAKLEVFSFKNVQALLVSSECAIEGISGKKLRVRAEACATLAHRLRNILRAHEVSITDWAVSESE